MARARLELADIFRAHGPAWRRAHAGHVGLTELEVMSAIEACRTEALGGHVAACLKCGHRHVAYNSCKNRHCPKCQGPAARDWMSARAEDLLPVEYFHVVFTLPAEVARVAYWNKRAVYGLLFRASAETVATIAASPRHLGARIGITSVLHTWGSALTHHPHVHMIVPGGGLSPNGARWIACRPGFFLPVRVLSRLFRRLFLDGLSALHGAGKLAFSATSRDWSTPPPSPPGSRRCARPSGSCTPSPRSAGPRPCSPISAATPGGDLEQPARQRRCRDRRVPLEGLPAEEPRAAQGHAARHRRIHPTPGSAISSAPPRRPGTTRSTPTSSCPSP